MAFVRWFRSQSVDVQVAIVAVLGVVCLVAWPVAMVAAITVIGLPIAIVMAAFPTFALVIVAWRLSYRALAAAGLRSLIASALLATLALALPPAIYNGRLDAKVNLLVDGDRKGPSPIVQGTTVGLRPPHSGGRLTTCDDLCRRLLLTGAAARVVVSEAAYAAGPPDPAAGAVAFRLETTGRVCPVVSEQRTWDIRLRLPDEPRGDETRELVRIAQVSGRCLLAEPARLGEALVVIGEGRVASGGDAYAAGLSPGYDTVRARRLSVHVAGAGTFEEAFRETRVAYDRLLPILAPSYASGSELRLAPVFLRTHKMIPASAGGLEADWPTVLRDIVRLDLGVGPLVAQASAGRTLRDAIATGQPLPVAAADLSNDVFARFVQQRKVMLADAEIAMAILRDRRLPVSQNAWVLVRHGQDLPDQMKREVAELLFARLRDLAAAPDRSPRALQAAGPIGTAIDELPEWIVRIHRGDLEWLAQEPSLRGPASSALRQLSVFGAEAVPTLVSLVDVGASLRGDGKKPAKDWQPPYLAGLIGLCRAGSSAAVAIPALIERIGRGDILVSNSDGRLALDTLIRLGTPPAIVEGAFLNAGAPPEDMQRDLKQAQRQPKCTY
ncbi:MAG: hypothetical protein ACOYOJ_09250 [Alsobacter sp.]